MKRDEFAVLVKEARSKSWYPDTRDFARALGLSYRSITAYESAEKLPGAEAFEKLITRAGIPAYLVDQLKVAHNAAKSETHGVVLNQLDLTLDLDELADRIQREIEYELKRANIKITPSMSRVCKRRIGMILKDVMRRT